MYPRKIKASSTVVIAQQAGNGDETKPSSSGDEIERLEDPEKPTAFDLDDESRLLSNHMEGHFRSYPCIGTANDGLGLMWLTKWIP